MTYYVSNYLNVISLEKTDLLFNGFNGCMDEVEKSLGDILRNKGEIKNDLPEDILHILKRRGHVTSLPKEKEVDAFVEYTKKLHKKKFENSNKSSFLMILFSYTCNLCCPYCYQRSISKDIWEAKMTPKFIDTLFENYIEKMFPNIPLENMTISLYGGEPFLLRNKDSIERVLFYAKKYKIRIEGVTNASQLELFPEEFFGPHYGQVQSLQVSLDGSRQNHDSSRIPADRSPTFDKIIANCHKLVERKVRLDLRVNVDALTLESVDELKEELLQVGLWDHPYCFPYVSVIHNHAGEADGFVVPTAIEASRRLNQKHSFLNSPLRRVANGLRYLTMQQSGTAVTRTTYCMQQNPYSYVCDALGRLFRCYEEAGHEEYVIGQFDAGLKDISWNSELKKYYEERTIFNMEECKECSCALICGGGCGVKSRGQTGNFYKAHCEEEKELYLQAIKENYLQWDSVQDGDAERFHLTPNV